MNKQTVEIKDNRITLYNVRIGTKGYRNFSGRETEWNKAGDRNFVVFLDTDVAKQLESIGAPVQWKPDKYDEGNLRAQMKVHVKYVDRKGQPLIPPKVVLISSSAKTPLDANTVGTLDTADLEKSDMILNIYKNPGTMGPANSVALKTLYATLSEDELDALYSRNDQSVEVKTW